MYNSLLLTIFCAAGGVLSNSYTLPCQLQDQACLEKMSNDLRPILFAASPEYGIESSDPVFVKEIVLDTAGFKFLLHDSFISGISSCVNSNFTMADDLSLSEYDLNCLQINVTGKYEMSGELMGIPAEGSGDISLTSGKYLIHLREEYDKRVKDGKTHISVTNFKLKAKYLEPVKFHLENLFNGQKDLADAFYKFSNENWTQILELFQEPILYGIFKKIFINANKYLDLLAVDDYIAV